MIFDDIEVICPLGQKTVIGLAQLDNDYVVRIRRTVDYQRFHLAAHEAAGLKNLLARRV